MFCFPVYDGRAGFFFNLLLSFASLSMSVVSPQRMIVAGGSGLFLRSASLSGSCLVLSFFSSFILWFSLFLLSLYLKLLSLIVIITGSDIIFFQ